MQRRKFLTLGVTATSAIAIVGTGAAWVIGPGLRDGRLAPAGHSVFRAVVDAVLEGLLPVDPAARTREVEAVLARLDASLAGFPRATQEELSRVLAILAHPGGRIALAGLNTGWGNATRAQVLEALASMRHSALQPRQQIYQALRDLTNAAYFADAGTWAGIGYGGPRELTTPGTVA